VVELASAEPLLSARCVIVVDACSALDVIRVPVRDKWVADAKSIQEMIEFVGDASLLVLAMPEAIEAEYRRHRDGTTDSVLNELRERHNALLSQSKALGEMIERCALVESEIPSIGMPDNWVEAVAGRFSASAETLHSLLSVVPHDEDDVSSAYSRVVHGLAPAAKGAASMNDSTLCEVALRIARQRHTGTTGLLTSNAQDFRPRGSLDSDLLTDYTAAGLVDLATWRDALRFVQAVAAP
jgi:hypothetical protein